MSETIPFFLLGLVAIPFCLIATRSLVGHEALAWVYLGCLKVRGGYCATCPFHTPRRDLAVALVLPAVFILAGRAGGFNPHTLGFCFFFAVALVLSLVDYDWEIIPDFFSVGGQWTGLLYHALLALAASQGIEATSFPRIDFSASLLGWALGLGIPYLFDRLFFLCTGYEGLGLGDVKLLGAIGAWLGPLGLLAVLVVASLAGVLFNLPLLAREIFRRNLRLVRFLIRHPESRPHLVRLLGRSLGVFTRYLPFGPFLATGFLLTYWLGPAVVLPGVGRAASHLFSFLFRG